MQVTPVKSIDDVKVGDLLRAERMSGCYASWAGDLCILARKREGLLYVRNLGTGETLGFYPERFDKVEETQDAQDT